MENKAEVQVVYVNQCNLQHPRTFQTQGEIAAVKVAWEKAMDIVKRGDEDHVINETKPMGKKECERLEGKWKHRHEFLFLANDLLALVTTNKMYQHANSNPRLFCIVAPEEMRLRSVITRKHETVLTTGEETPDGKKKAEFETIEVDPVLSHQVFFKKVVAFWQTWSLVSIDEHDWFSYQQARAAIVIFEEKIFRRVEGHRPTLEWIFKAWLKTMNIFLDQINVHKKTLGDMIEDSHKWEAVWNWSPPSKSKAVPDNEPSAGTGGVTTTGSLDPKIEQSVLSTLKMAKMALNLKGKGKGKDRRYVKKKGKGDKGQGKGGKGKDKKWKNYDGGKGTWKKWNYGGKGTWKKQKKGDKYWG